MIDLDDNTSTDKMTIQDNPRNPANDRIPRITGY